MWGVESSAAEGALHSGVIVAAACVGVGVSDGRLARENTHTADVASAEEFLNLAVEKRQAVRHLSNESQVGIKAGN